MKLFIAEKPDLGKTIAQGLGDGQAGNGFIKCGHNIVTWCFGHLLEMDDPDQYDEKYKKWKKEDLPIIPNSFQRSAKKTAKKQLKIIGELLKDAGTVVNAGDPDREGQLLIDEVLEHHNFTGPCQRIWLSSLDKKSVKNALGNLDENQKYAPLRDAARARSQADWLVGMNCTRAMTLMGQTAGSQGVLSMGRVQTPTLALIVSRDLAIKNFKPHSYFVLEVEIKHENGNFKAIYQPDDTQSLDEKGRLINREIANQIEGAVNSQPGQIKAATKEKKKKNPPLPHCLSSLQKSASAKYGMGAKQVLDLAQGLYEKKLTTYPRSDCRYLPEEQFELAGNIITALATDVSELKQIAGNADSTIKGPVYNTKKITAHHAIIPTGEIPKSLSLDESNLYKMIARAFCVQFYPVMEYETQTILTDVNDNIWKTTGRTILHSGWTAYLKESKEDEQLEEQTLPIVKEGDNITTGRVKIKEKATTPPASFTEGTLIEAMTNIHKFVEDKEAKKTLKENEGIGTEATRANIIELLKNRRVIKLQKKKILSTDLGRDLVNMAPAMLTDPVTTAQWESKLSAIANGQETLPIFMTEQTIQVRELVTTILNLKIEPMAGSHLCPECSQALARRKNKKGSWYWGCFNKDHSSGKPIFVNDKNGKPDFTPKKEIELSTEHKCQACDKPLIRRESKKKAKGGKKTYWWGCSGFPGCKQMYFDDNGKPQSKK